MQYTALQILKIITPASVVSFAYLAQKAQRIPLAKFVLAEDTSQLDKLDKKDKPDVQNAQQSLSSGASTTLTTSSTATNSATAMNLASVIEGEGQLLTMTEAGIPTIIIEKRKSFLANRKLQKKELLHLYEECSQIEIIDHSESDGDEEDNVLEPECGTLLNYRRF
jgi:hypothetical protein